MESDAARVNWGSMPRWQRERFARQLRHACRRQGILLNYYGEDVACMPYECLTDDVKRELAKAVDGDSFSVDAWERAHQQLAAAKTG